jgi:hypothetical protein
MTASRAHQAEVSERRRKLLQLRRAGVRFDEQEILDLGYSSAASARKDLKRCLEQHRDEERAEVSVYRQQENERLDALLEAAWPQATTRQPILDKEGEVVAHAVDMRAVDTVLRLMDRRAKLNGLDMPVKTEVSGPDGGAIPFSGADLSELQALIAIADQENPALPSQDEDTDGDSHA